MGAINFICSLVIHSIAVRLCSKIRTKLFVSGLCVYLICRLGWYLFLLCHSVAKGVHLFSCAYPGLSLPARALHLQQAFMSSFSSFCARAFLLHKRTNLYLSFLVIWRWEWSFLLCVHFSCARGPSLRACAPHLLQMSILCPACAFCCCKRGLPLPICASHKAGEEHILSCASCLQVRIISSIVCSSFERENQACSSSAHHKGKVVISVLRCISFERWHWREISDFDTCKRSHNEACFLEGRRWRAPWEAHSCIPLAHTTRFSNADLYKQSGLLLTKVLDRQQNLVAKADSRLQKKSLVAREFLVANENSRFQTKKVGWKERKTFCTRNYLVAKELLESIRKKTSFLHS